MNKLKVYSFLQILIFFIAIFMMYKEYTAIVDLVNHNKVINSIIIIIFISTTVSVMIDTLVSLRKYRAYKRSDNVIAFFNNTYAVVNPDTGEISDAVFNAWRTFTGQKSMTLDFISGSLIGLGLLGTFIGLMHTMGSVFSVLSTSIQGKDLVTGLAVPLSGMSTAFSASMLGLISSLTVGLQSNIMGKLDEQLIFELDKGVEKYLNGSIDEEHEDVIKLKDANAKGYLWSISNYVKEINDNFITAGTNDREMAKELKGYHESIVRLNQSIDSLSTNTKKMHENLQGINQALASNNGRIERLRLNIDSAMQLSLSSTRDIKESISKVNESINKIISSNQNDNGSIEKISMLQNLIYDSGVASLSEIVETRTLVESVLSSNGRHIVQLGKTNDE